jgi:DNA polymerase III epsilon subunit-like protein
MQDKIYAYLKSQKSGATSDELVQQVLRIKGASPGISEKLIRTAIAGDRRFTLDEHYYWKAVEKCTTPLTEAKFVLLSFLSVDTVKRKKTIIEISAQKLTGNTITERFHVIINPNSLVLPAGNITVDLLQEIKKGLPEDKAARTLSSFLEDATIVGYDIQSCVNQLNLTLGKFDESIENPSLCLRLLTEKCIPELHPKSLQDIAAFLKISVTDIQRTENEVNIISEIFHRFLELLNEKGINTMEEALEFQCPYVDYVDFSRYTFDKYFLWAIPQKPGIYKMKNKHGEIIYVGKAKNLKARINSYFWNNRERLQKITDLLNNIYSIEYKETGSELTALLTEFRLIKQFHPRLNQQLEVHERTARYGNLKNFIIILPSPLEECLELFFVHETFPLQRYEILIDTVNFSDVENIIDNKYFNSNIYNKLNRKINKKPARFEDAEEGKHLDILSETEMGEIDLVLSWVDRNKDYINYINVDTAGNKEDCLKLLKDYIKDEETLKRKHFRPI